MHVYSDILLLTSKEFFLDFYLFWSGDPKAFSQLIRSWDVFEKSVQAKFRHDLLLNTPPKVADFYSVFSAPPPT